MLTNGVGKYYQTKKIIFWRLVFLLIDIKLFIYKNAANLPGYMDEGNGYKSWA